MRERERERELESERERERERELERASRACSRDTSFLDFGDDLIQYVRGHS